ncbi:MAG TPA: hypothetical protein PLH56_06220 [Candidatus Omnitrophota bacterium]|nr:hypothetical protein [Candidatus Omnitrophota bacterium]HPN88913.1 hypothetical protein [Candidatus Omnitrophota bacterium]
MNKKSLTAVGLISGGLDSILAAKILKDLNVNIVGIHFHIPWGCASKNKAIELAQTIEIPLKIFELNESFIEIIKNPKYGIGSGMNPCVDCKIYFLTEAAKYMKEINADFIFTGEVLGQRPMSQLKNSLRQIEKASGLKGYLLRPLCAQLLEPTFPEQQGLINRTQLLAINGRGRKQQIALAKKYHILNYPQPAGGCLLTDKNFSRRLKDAFHHKEDNFSTIKFLPIGRYFRINKNFKAILGRNQNENIALIKNACDEDIIMELPDKLGPTLILKGADPSQDVLSLCAGLIQKFSKHKNSLTPQKMIYWKAQTPEHKKNIHAIILSNEAIKKIQL